ncbi:hypothetical protein CKF54_04025 [Psittacicella hinzii]|uniref:CDP-Glycerol:Poly(Glycerophosphate) glycerophosphotransferase n=1 Tax=Psittacicella hinzii TaxID=2028575 RepID=A0A3A1Y6G8_9GAMM|nr:CDP-glycerol glycerophosphotransferase [Psittacicella hinzii]RIY32869.1 hypothetical protein CKF54_04025 [Psittacicella hinzii]
MIYLYLDTKIVGAAKQIVNFFTDQVLDKDKTVVLVKRYKHKSSRLIEQIFVQHQIIFRFVSYDELDQLEEGVILYPFNAQSNCRAVANRRLKHVFITHGESNKISSVKPILRIYDHIITAGQLGLQRLVESKILSSYDLSQQRAFTMGNTFIGQTQLKPRADFASPEGDICFYAPTWEGGIARENYSSLQEPVKVATTLIQACKLYGLSKVVMQPHPNAGFRVKEILLDFLTQVYPLLKAQGIALEVYLKNVELGFWQKFKLKRLGVKVISELKGYQARIAFCDLSAIETQLLNENIPHYLFFYQDNLALLPQSLQQQDYLNHLIMLDQDVRELKAFSAQELAYFHTLQQLYIDPSLHHCASKDRIAFLLTKLYGGTDNEKIDHSN